MGLPRATYGVALGGLHLEGHVPGSLLTPPCLVQTSLPSLDVNHILRKQSGPQFLFYFGS